mmetsp:Transcript_23769/g.21125  ORF Transcript_23769/g.21125 Transcript_23769/m.21125 type:complete len:132 (-) Transcript_23769:12-407(-)
MVYTLRIGAHVNSFFDIHKDKLLALKTSFIRVKHNYKNLSLKKRFNCNCIKIIVEKFKELDVSEDKREGTIEDCIEAIDHNIEILDHDKEHSSLKILGVTCSYELMNSIYTGLFSLGLASGQYLYNQGAFQ